MDRYYSRRFYSISNTLSFPLSFNDVKLNYSKEQIFHYTCEECDMWWSIAAENMNMDKKIWTCPWCSHMHKPPHRDTSHYFGNTQSQRKIG